MMGKAKSLKPKLFYTQVNLAERVPADYPLRRIKRMIDFSFVRAQVAGLYGYNGNESLDPVLVLKLQFLLFYENIRSERELMKVLPMRLDWMWFCDMDLDETIPDHSVLSKARRRWGLQTYQSLFVHVLQACVDAGLVEGGTSHVDSTLLKANASVDSRIPRKLWEQLERAQAHEEPPPSAPPDSYTPHEEPPPSAPPAPRTPPPPQDTQVPELPAPPQGKFNTRTVSRTDPDSATVHRRGRGTFLGYLDHSLIDDKCGVVVATVATPGDYDDAAMLPTLVNKQVQYLQQPPSRVVGDSAYGTLANQEWFGQQGILAYLKPRTGKRRIQDWTDYLPDDCDPRRARRLMARRMTCAEGRFAQAHVRYNHRRCRWRRRWRVQIQCYLVAIVQNIAKLIRFVRPCPPGATGVLSNAFAKIRPVIISTIRTLCTLWSDLQTTSGPCLPDREVATV